MKHRHLQLAFGFPLGTVAKIFTKPVDCSLMAVLLNGLVLRGIEHASRLQLVVLVRHITTDTMSRRSHGEDRWRTAIPIEAAWQSSRREQRRVALSVAGFVESGKRARTDL